MAIYLNNEQLPSLSRSLQNIPKANHIRGEILSKLRSVITDYDFIVDRWPDYRALVVRANTVSAKYLNHLRLETLVYATDCDALGILLQMPNIIDWSSRIGFGGVYPYEMPVVVDVMQKHHRNLHMELYFDMKVTEKTLKLRSIPNGFSMRSLIPEQAILVSSIWPYSQGIHSESYVKELIMKQPSCCLYNREGSLVGYALAYHYGYIGFLHVMKEHRRKGYGQVIISYLAALCLKHMEEVHLYVQEENKASTELTKSVGFEAVYDQASWWIRKEAF
ncbi:glycine N-acyltransferase-like [Haliotis asinina]|uniref:glycine N-acyltransferase-like n=1 Tax=Haliotis asinina TaxID=109174 RepID=UPI00353182F2